MVSLYEALQSEYGHGKHDAVNKWLRSVGRNWNFSHPKVLFADFKSWTDEVVKAVQKSRVSVTGLKRAWGVKLTVNVAFGSGLSQDKRNRQETEGTGRKIPKKKHRKREETMDGIVSTYVAVVQAAEMSAAAAEAEIVSNRRRLADNEQELAELKEQVRK